MDMTRHLHRWLNDGSLREMGDSFEDRISDVVEELIRNRFTKQKVLEPVVIFESGWRLLPNITQRRALIEFFGPQSDDWIGRRLRVYRHRIDRVDATSGRPKTTWEKRVCLPATASIHMARTGTDEDR